MTAADFDDRVGLRSVPIEASDVKDSAQPRFWARIQSSYNFPSTTRTSTTLTLPCALASSLLSLGATGVFVTPGVDTTLKSGRWFRLRLQLFPDVTCGVAIDARPLWRSRLSVSLDRPCAILLGVASSGTRVLHGPLTLGTGVRDDVDWSALGFQSP